MENLLRVLKEQFREVEQESYLIKNTSSRVKYPYVTYNFITQKLSPNRERLYLDVNIFSNQTSYTDIFILEEKIKSHFTNLQVMNDDILLMFNIENTSTIQTGDDLIKRRLIDIKAIVDWRKKKWD